MAALPSPASGCDSRWETPNQPPPVMGIIPPPARGCLHPPSPQIPWVPLHPVSPHRSREAQRFPPRAGAQPPSHGGKGKPAGVGRAERKSEVEIPPRRPGSAASSHPSPGRVPLLRRRASPVSPVLCQPSLGAAWIHPMGLALGGQTSIAGGERAPGAGLWGKEPTLRRLPAWQSHLDQAGLGKGNREMFGRGGLGCWQHQHQRQPCLGGGKLRGGSPPNRATKGWHRVGGSRRPRCGIPLGVLVLLGGILQSWEPAGGIWESPAVLGRGPPTPPGPGAGCRSRAEVSPAFGWNSLRGRSAAGLWSAQAADAIPG